jgi:aryl carrier-like protein
MAIYRNLEQASEGSQGGETADALRILIASVQEDVGRLQEKEACETLVTAIVRCVAGFLMKGDEEIDPSRSLDAAGVDSLVAIELRNWWRQRLGTDVTVLELLNGGSFEQLAQLAVVQLGKKYGQRIGSNR